VPARVLEDYRSEERRQARLSGRHRQAGACSASQWLILLAFLGSGAVDACSQLAQGSQAPGFLAMALIQQPTPPAIYVRCPPPRLPRPGTFRARNVPASWRCEGGRERRRTAIPPPRRRGPRCAGFYSPPPSPPRRPRPCTGRASVPRRLRTRAAASGAPRPAEAPCRPPRGPTAAPATRRPTPTGLGLTAAAARPEATVSTAAAGGSGAPRRGGRPRAGRRASAPGTRLPTAANPRPGLPRTRSSTSACLGASRGATRYGAGRRWREACGPAPREGGRKGAAAAARPAGHGRARRGLLARRGVRRLHRDLQGRARFAPHWGNACLLPMAERVEKPQLRELCDQEREEAPRPG